MGTRTIDGTLEAVWLKRRRAGAAVYDRMQFRLADGRAVTVGKSVVGAAVADRLVPGTSGRFYLYEAIDHKGLHGVRDASGGAVYAFPTVNETAMAVVASLNLAWLAASVALADKVPLLPLFVTLIAVPGYFLYRATRMAARRQFENDAGYQAAAADSAAAAGTAAAGDAVHA
ncbi:MAG TPA: hypothetical protein VF702_03835 [Allosphingosinicella sp.]|jgi:hypothetical protein